MAKAAAAFHDKKDALAIKATGSSGDRMLTIPLVAALGYHWPQGGLELPTILSGGL